MLNNRTRVSGANDSAPIVYLVDREGNSSVFQSMVARLVVQLRKQGVPLHDLVVISPIGEFVRLPARRIWERNQQLLRSEFGGRVTRLVAPPTRVQNWWDAATLFRRWLRRHFGHDESPIVHCRGAQAACIANAARKTLPNLKTIFDMRGLQFSEHLLKNGCTHIDNASPEVAQSTQQIRDAECRAAVESNAMVCVSNQMADYVQAEFNVNPHKMRVIPNHFPIGEQIPAASTMPSPNENATSDRFTVAYCGSLDIWQCPRSMLDLFAKIKMHRPTARFLMLTQHMRRAEEMLNGFPHKSDVSYHAVQHQEASEWLEHADVAILPRGLANGPHLADRVSSPIKYAEYLASGTPVIMSEGVGDYSELTRRENVGLVLPTPFDGNRANVLLRQFLDGYCAAPREWQARCRQVAQQELDSSVHLPKVMNLYHQLSSHTA